MYRYFEELDFPDLFNEYTGSNGHLVYRPWDGGFNNIRMSYEIATCLAFLLDKTLVLPLPYKIYLLDKEAGLDFYFDMSDTGIFTTPFKDYAKMVGVEPSYNAVAMKAPVYDRSDLNHSFYKLADEVPKWYGRHRSAIDLKRFSRCETVFFDGQLLGNFYQTIYSPKMHMLKRLIAKHIRFRDEIFDAAKRAVSKLPKFAAMHVRRGDFQYTHAIPSQSELVKVVSSLIPAGTPIYVSTDEHDKSFFDPLRKRHQLFFYDDVQEEIDPSWIPMVEQLICTQGSKFLQARFSTFSSYIFRLRGYMKAQDVLNYDTQRGNFAQITFSEETEFDSNWVREYKDVFDFRSAF